MTTAYEHGNQMTDSDIESTLEGMIDRWTMVSVLDALVDICDGKAGHLRSNWQDETSARVWDYLARRIIIARDDAQESNI